MRLAEAYVIAKAMSKKLKRATDDMAADMQDELERLQEQFGVDRVVAEVGDQSVKLTLVEGSPRLDGFGERFLDFMESKGMTTRAVLPEWKNHVERTPEGAVVWRETGEVVPGASWSHGAVFVRTSPLDADAVLREARDEGLIEKAIPMIGGAE